VRGKRRIVLDPGESLFLRRGDQAAVNHQSGRAIMIESRDTKDCSHARVP
jgi:hypothetical protein